MSIEKFGKNFNPLVSVIIPVYNGSNYVKEAIDSAIAQTYKNIEIIVVNDGSTDDTEKIVKSFGKKLRYFKKENGGVATALNLGIKEAKGEYISWLSHDDMYYPNKIERQIEELRKLDIVDRNKTILYSNFILIDDKSKKIDEFRIEKRYDIKKFNYPLYPVVNCIIHGCTLLIPKNCFDDVGLFDAKLRSTQDYDLWFKMFPKYKLLFDPYFGVKFRQHDLQGSKIIKGTTNEVDELWLRIYKTITDKQKVEINGSLVLFYKERLRFAINMNLPKCQLYLGKCLKESGGKISEIEEIYIKLRDRFVNKVRRTYYLFK